MVSPTMSFLHGCNDRVLGAESLGVELGVLEPKVLFQLRVEPEPEGALGTLKRLHALIVAHVDHLSPPTRRRGPGGPLLF